MRRLRTLSEAECYVRCYGAKDGLVRVVQLRGSGAARVSPGLSAEGVRQLFETRLDARLGDAFA